MSELEGVDLLARTMMPRLGGVPQVDALARIGQIISTAGLADYPPTVLVGDAEINVPMRISGAIWDYHPGDVVIWMQRADVPVVIDVLPTVGSETEFGHEDFEPWNEIGAAGQPSFQNSWVNFGAPHETAAFWKQSDGWVRLKGTVKDGTVAAGTPMFTLPVGYRPPLPFYFVVNVNGSTGVVRILQNGEVRTHLNINNSYVSLNGITFPSSMNGTDDFNTMMNHGRWEVPAFGSGWEKGGAATAEINFFVRNDGWVWLTGVVNAISVPDDAFALTNESAAGWRGHMLAGLALGIARHDVGGGSAASNRSPRNWRVVTGGTGDQHLGGLNYFGRRATLGDYHVPGTDVTFQNSWTNFGSDWQNVRYRKDPHGVVHIWGLAEGGASSADTIFTLPVGFRPGATQIFNSLFTGNLQGRIDVSTSGTVTAALHGNNGFASLSGISFRAMV